MNCPEESILSSFVNCTLSQAMSDALEEHLAECPECRRKVSELERTQPLEFALSDVSVSSVSGLSAARRHVEETLENEEFLHLPQLVGPYLITKRLGQGGMGTVYAAEHQILRRKFAVKFVRPKFLLNSERLERFQKEILAAGKLVHPNIVSATDAGVFENTPFLVMEFLVGETLSDYVRKKGGRLPLREALNILSQVACGLDFAHSAGLIHCDVKPSNLWRLPDGTIKIMDLGLASASEDFEENSAHPILGTPNFMAPEQSIPQAKMDSRIDIYALGCVFFYLLTGLTQQDCICRGIEFPNLKEAGISVPRKVQNFLNLMTKTTAARRIASMAAVSQTLNELQKPFWKTPGFAMKGLAVLLGIVLLGLWLPGSRNSAKRTLAERTETTVQSDEGENHFKGPASKFDVPPLQVETSVQDENEPSPQTEEQVKEKEVVGEKEEEEGLSPSISGNAEAEPPALPAESPEYSPEDEQKPKMAGAPKAPQRERKAGTLKTGNGSLRPVKVTKIGPEDEETAHFGRYYSKIEEESKRLDEIHKEQVEYEKILGNLSDSQESFPYRDVPKVKMENSSEIPEINWEEKRNALSLVGDDEEEEKKKAEAVYRSAERITNRLFMTMDMNKGENLLDASMLKEFEEPIQRLEKALEMGSEEAIHGLWDLYWHGIYEPESPDDLYQKLLESARGGNIGAIRSVALECWFGHFHERDPEKAVQWFWNAVTSNLQNETVHECLFYLGRAYDLGEGVPQSHQNALICYECATTSGDAVCEVGISYLTGNGYKKDPQKAFSLFLMCVERSVKSEYMLGYCLENCEEFNLDMKDLSKTERDELAIGLYRETILCDKVMMALGFKSCLTPELLREFPSSLFFKVEIP